MKNSINDVEGGLFVFLVCSTAAIACALVSATYSPRRIVTKSAVTNFRGPALPGVEIDCHGSTRQIVRGKVLVLAEGRPEIPTSVQMRDGDLRWDIHISGELCTVDAVELGSDKE